MADETQKSQTAPEGGSGASEKAVETAAAAKVAAEAARAEERQRMAALMAAFPNDAAFAAKQFESGASVDQAKAAYCDVLAERLAQAEATIAELREKGAAKQGEAASANTTTTTPPGAKPVPHGEAKEGAADFMAEARARAKEGKISMREAMRQLAAEDPDAHQAWLERQKTRC